MKATGSHPDQFDIVAEMVAESLRWPEWFRDELETLFCETMEGHFLRVYDIFFKGQSLFTFNKHGRTVTKKYGQREWTDMITGAPYRFR